MRSYGILVLDHAKGSKVVATPVVYEAQLPEAIAFILAARPLVGFEVVPMSAAAAAEATRWGPEYMAWLREWAGKLPMDFMTGSPGDPHGREAALERARRLCLMLDGAELQEHSNGVTVRRPGEQMPAAFLHFAPLPAELN